MSKNISSKAHMAKEKKSVAMLWKDEAPLQHPVSSDQDQPESGHSPEVEQGPAATAGGGQVELFKSTIFKTLRSRPVMQSVLSSGPTTFEPFMRLPRELRLMIWDLSKYDPRIIFAGSKYESQYCLNSLTHQPLPALPAGLQVHQESRYHFLKTYHALFYCFLRSQMTIYIDPKVDILFHYSTSDYNPSVDRAIIERVTWEYSPQSSWPNSSFDWPDIALYPALKEVVVQLSHDLDDEWNLGNWSEEERWTDLGTGKPDHWVKGAKIDRFFCATGYVGERPGKWSTDENLLYWNYGYVFRRIEQ